MDADRFVFVEVGLNSAALVDGNFVGHDGAETFENCSLRLIDGAARIDDLAADVANGPGFVHLHFFFVAYGEFDDICEVAAVRELEGEALRAAFR